MRKRTRRPAKSSFHSWPTHGFFLHEVVYVVNACYKTFRIKAIFGCSSWLLSHTHRYQVQPLPVLLPFAFSFAEINWVLYLVSECLRVAEYLINDAKANVNAMNHRGDTALSLAAFWGRVRPIALRCNQDSCFELTSGMFISSNPVRVLWTPAFHVCSRTFPLAPNLLELSCPSRRPRMLFLAC